jgi:hypothetical protein
MLISSTANKILSSTLLLNLTSYTNLITGNGVELDGINQLLRYYEFVRY